MLGVLSVSTVAQWELIIPEWTGGGSIAVVIWNDVSSNTRTPFVSSATRHVQHTVFYIIVDKRIRTFDIRVYGNNKDR